MQITKQFQSELEQIRHGGRNDLKPATELINLLDCKMKHLECERNQQKMHQFCDRMKVVSLASNTKMKVLAGKIIQKSIDMCTQKPPCKFTAVAMGSLAKGEATPYSDLEFMFLVGTKNASTTEYFELLAVTIYFLIGNLQETKLKYMNIEELKTLDFKDDCKNGFKIDGLQPKAGNIPTGNGSPQQKNRFILTVAEMIKNYQQVIDTPHPTESLKGDFAAMLAHTAVLYGDSSLEKEFAMAKSAMKPNKTRNDAHHKMIQRDVDDYNFLPLDGISQTHGKYYQGNAKTDVYRFPSILIL